MRQLQPTAPTRPSVFTLLSDEIIHPLQFKAPARNRSKVVKLDEKVIALRRPGTAAEVEPCPKEHRSRVCRAEEPRPSPVDSFLAEKRNLWSSMMTDGRQSRRLKRSGENEAGVVAGLRPSAKAEDVIDTTPAYSGALRSEAGSAYQMLKVAVYDYCSVRDTDFNELQDLYGLETGCAFSRMVTHLQHSQGAVSCQLRSRCVLKERY